MIDGVIIKTSKGKRKYQYINIKGKTVRLHYYLAENYIVKRKLLRNELVHHKDQNSLNNEFSNLQVLTRAEHIRIHKPCKGYKFTDEQKKRLSKAHKGIKHTQKTRIKMSKTRKGRKITWGDKISKAKRKNLDISKILELHESGLNDRQIAERLGVCRSTIYNRLKEYLT